MAEHDAPGAITLPIPAERGHLARVPRALGPRRGGILAGFVAAVMGVYIGCTEGGPFNVLFALSVVLTIGSLVALFSRRVLFSTVLTTIVVVLLCAIASLKQQATDVALHAYDVVSLVTSWSAVGAFYHHHPQVAIALLAGLMVTLTMAWVSYRVDDTRGRPRNGGRIGANLSTDA